MVSSIAQLPRPGMHFDVKIVSGGGVKYLGVMKKRGREIKQDKG